MKKTLLILAGLLTGMMAFAQQQLTAFPGAEGYGKFTTGGRGGVVYHVTRLDDCTDADLVEGTLRWALRTGDDTPRTVVFDTCGTIVLTSKLKLQYPNVTIAGQTAPGGGICVAGACIYVCKPNVIIRYIRFRPGDIMKSKFQCLDVENTKHVIIDHCSMTWAVEECLTMYDCDSTTVQWSIIAEGLYSAGHSKGSRSYATQWGGEHGTMHHCLIANCYNRTPRFNGVRSESNVGQGKHDHDVYVDNEFVNNVIYNWGKKNSLYGGENDTTINKVDGECVGYDHIYMVNNYFRCGPATKAANLSQRYFVQGSKAKDYGRWYLSGNKFETGNPWNAIARNCWTDAELEKVNADNMYGYTTNVGNRAFNLDGLSASQASFDRYVLPDRYAHSALEAETADNAYAAVCSGAGASLPRYDEQDLRVLAEAAGTQDPQFVGGTQSAWTGIIDSQNDITFTKMDSSLVNIKGDTTYHHYPYIGLEEGDVLPIDTDRDGMPDAWETENGLNPNDATDGAACTLSQLPGYTNLEYFLNGGDGEMSDPIPAPQPIPMLLDTYYQTVRAAKRILHGQVLLEYGDVRFNMKGQRM